mgnify:CR=1 FL=1
MESDLSTIWPLQNLWSTTDGALPKISVIIPNYNNAEGLRRTLESLRAQNYANLETIVMDGGSDDHSVEVIRDYEKILAHWQSTSDEGQYDAIQKGSTYVSGELMAWLNSGDIYLPWTLHLVARIFHDVSDCEWLLGLPSKMQLGVPFGMRDPGVYSARCIAHGLYRHDLLGWIQQESAFWRTELWNQVGGLRADIRYAADYELWTRFAEHANAYAVPMVLSGFEYGASNRSRLHFSEYVAEMDAVVREWPEQKQKRHRKWLRAFHLYQRARSYTGIKGMVRRAFGLSKEQGVRLKWNFDQSVFRKNIQSVFP